MLGQRDRQQPVLRRGAGFLAGTGNVVEGDAINDNGFGQPLAGRGDGVLIVDSAYTSVIDCTIESNRDWGIVVTSSGHVVLTGNAIANNGLGSILVS